MVRTLLGGRVAAWRWTAILAAGDALAIALFVAAGELQHARPLLSGAPTLLAFLAGWTVAAVGLGAYGTDALVAPGRAGVLALGAWVIGSLVGHVVRVVVEPGATIAPAFVLVSLAVGGVLLVGWRAGLAWWRFRS